MEEVSSLPNYLFPVISRSSGLLFDTVGELSFKNLKILAELFQTDRFHYNFDPFVKQKALIND